MNRKQFILLLVVVAVIGAAGLLVHQRDQQSWQSSSQAIGQKLLPDLPVNDIAQIIFRYGTNELSLAKSDNRWRVRERGDYPANFSQISDLLMKFADLKVAQSEDIGPSQLGRFELLPPGPGANTATQVEFKNTTGQTRASVLLGKQHLKIPPDNSQPAGMGGNGWPDGRYVMTDSDAKTVAVVSDALDSVQTRPEAWLNKDFFSIEKPRSIAVQFLDAASSWKLTRTSETNDWQIADAKIGEELDAAKISGMTSPFSSPSFNDVLPADTKPEISGLTNLTMVTVETFDGFTYIAKVGQSRNGNYPVTLAITASFPTTRTSAKDEKTGDKARLDTEFADQQKTLAAKLAKEQQYNNWIYQIPSYSLDPLLKHRGDLLVVQNKNAGTNSVIEK